LLLSMLIVLMYDISLSIEPSLKLNIHNQCLSVNLVSPTYLIDYRSTCYIPPNYKVRTGSTMSSSFALKSDYVTGVLTYRLQRKWSYVSTGIGKDTSNDVQLLVVWRTSEYGLSADVLMIEHDKEFDWNESNLGKLYNKNMDQFRQCHNHAIEIWSLDDDVALMITSEIMNEDLILDITISELEKDNGARAPARIEPGR
jgi:hypothetical protein